MNSLKVVGMKRLVCLNHNGDFLVQLTAAIVLYREIRCPSGPRSTYLARLECPSNIDNPTCTR